MPVSVSVEEESYLAGTSLRVHGGFRGEDTPSVEVPYAIYLSRDPNFDLEDVLLGGDLVRIEPLITSEVEITVELPANRFGSYYVLAVINEGGRAIYERRRGNNALASRRIDLLGADVAVRDARLRALPALPDARALMQGGRGELEFTVANLSEVAAGDFQCALVGLPALSDGRQARFGPFVLAANGAFTVTATVAVPRTAEGSYRVLLVCDSFLGRHEASETNNVFQMGSYAVLSARPELRGQLRAVEAKSAASLEGLSAGDTLAITRVIDNVGTDGATAPYRYVLASRGEWDLADRMVEVGASGSSERTDEVELPADVPAGAYRLVLELDPEQTLAELDRSDNRILGPELIVLEGAGGLDDAGSLELSESQGCRAADARSPVGLGLLGFLALGFVRRRGRLFHRAADE